MSKAISVLDGRYADRLKDVAEVGSEEFLIMEKLEVEKNWVKKLVELKDLPIDPTVRSLIMRIASYDMKQFVDSKPESQVANEVKAIESRTNHDSKAVELYARALFDFHLKNLNAPIQTFVVANSLLHFGLTSEDITNCAYAKSFKTIVYIFMQCVSQTLDHLHELACRHADCVMLGMTHGQPASPTTFGKEMAVFVYRLHTQFKRLRKALSEDCRVKWGGAIGSHNALKAVYPNINWLTISDEFVREHLQMQRAQCTTQVESRDWIAGICFIVMQVNTIGLDLVRDVWLYISRNLLRLKVNDQEIGSSTMPHKINPIDFENAEGNLGMANANLNHLALYLPVSRMQRDLSDSTRLRNLSSSFGYAILAWRSINRGLQRIEINADQIEHELECHWEILAEFVQTLLRKSAAESTSVAPVEDPYEKLRAWSQGKPEITKHDYVGLIESIRSSFSDGDVDILKTIKHPRDYIGYSIEIANWIDSTDDAEACLLPP